MYGQEITKEYERWLELVKDEQLKDELLEMKDSDEAIIESFASELSFGTGGLRGKLGVGTCKMNIYTVSRATVGLAKYINKNGGYGVAIGYDTRKNSRLFAERCAQILSCHGIKSYVYSSALPTPMLSYAVRTLGLSAGIMITASHNPAIYNGYKVYGADGCQITDTAACEILDLIKKSDYFECENTVPFSMLLSDKTAEYISEEVYKNYLSQVECCSMLHGDECDKSIKIVYTPLNGTGYKPVTDILKKNGYNNLATVSEQSDPDQNFTTCKKPNPELDEALELGLLLSKKENADLLIATDPDCDRVGVAIKDGNGYKRLTGNEVGLLLLDYILSQKKKHETLKGNPVFIKTIVTTPLAEKIAKKYGVETKNVLTGFKYIGEQIGLLEKEGRSVDYVLGFEESCGYLGGTYVRDKDGVFASLLVAEMTAYYKAKGIFTVEKLKEIYNTYGYCKDRLISYEFDSADRKSKINEMMKKLRSQDSKERLAFSDKKDYLDGIDGLPVSDVLSFTFADGDTMTVRPSGTEPKIKFYYYTIAENEEFCNEKMSELIKRIENYIF